MFTGIIEGLGKVHRLEDGRLELSVPPAEAGLTERLAIGESVSVNGVCLTLLPDFGETWRFDLSPETIQRTSFQRLGAGSVVNLERAMRADGRFGGHVVQGHVDATGTVVSVEPQGSSVVMTFEIPEAGSRYLIDKGSITIDGVSLTVVRPMETKFEVWLIPHTLEMTNLGTLRPGSIVNLEYDVIAKYVERMTRS